MAYAYLSQALSQICGAINTPPQYILPTIQNMAAGNYISEIQDVQEVFKDDGTLDALDFYHRLTDSNGNVIYVRFRYYYKELPNLAASLKQYPQVTTWQDVVGLKEDITVAPKPKSNYMKIAVRTASLASASATSPTVSPASAPPAKRGGPPSRLSSRHSKPMQTSRQALIPEDEDEDDWDEDDWDEDDDLLDESDE